MITFVKSSRSTISDYCVEVAYRKSTYSDAGYCVEVAGCACHVRMRDSKDPTGPVLTFTRPDWSSFLGWVRG